jgi:hypothetical protein
MCEPTHPKTRGQRSEAAVIHEFVRRGITVLQPFGDNERYDLVVDISGTFYRIQVKTGRTVNGRVQFETRSTATFPNRVEKNGYEGQIDVFVVYSPERMETYVVPVSEAPRTSMGLRIDDPDKQSPNVNWADEYRLDTWLTALD